MKTKRLPILIAVVVSSLLLSIVSLRNQSAALSASDWRAGDIIDDAIFFNGTDMSVAQIQSFLNSLVPTCDTWGTKMHETIPGKTRAQVGTEYGNPPPYICVKNYYENPTNHKTNFNSTASIPAGAQSAAQIIYNAAKDYDINPKVLLVTIKKEAANNLLGDDWPWLNQYRSATGYGCPDTAACDSQYYGFYNQVRNAARQFRSYATYPDSYRRKAGGTYAIQYHPNTSCSSSNVYMANQATAGLYNYTPYQPNAAALANLRGTGNNCSAYGNRNFWVVFTEWFGSTHYTLKGPIADYYLSIGGEESELGYVTGNQVCGLAQNGCRQAFQNGTVYWTEQTGAQVVKGGIRNRWAALGAEKSALGYPTGPEVATSNGGWQQPYQNGFIIGKYETGYWESKGNIRNRWLALGAEEGALGYPIGAETATSSGGWQQQYQNGYIVGQYDTGYWESRGSIRKRWIALNAERGTLGYPTGPEVATTSGGWQQPYQYGHIVGQYETGYWESKGNIRNRWVALGAEGGILGYPIGPETVTSNGGWQQPYQNGYIVGRYDVGYWESKGSIRKRWLALGAEGGSLGYPTGPEVATSNGGWRQQYQNGYMVGKYDTGYWESKGSIRKRWLELNAEQGVLGYPIGAETATSSGGWQQQYQNGYIVGKYNTGYHEVLHNI